MSRRRPEGRRRPGRRPPNRYSGRHGPAPQGFTGPGFHQFYNRMLPGLGGASKKQYFNEISAGIVLSTGLCGALLGLVCLGWLGAIVGLGLGLAAGGTFVEKNRFHR